MNTQSKSVLVNPRSECRIKKRQCGPVGSEKNKQYFALIITYHQKQLLAKPSDKDI